MTITIVIAMYQKTVEREEGYSKEEISGIKKAFAELKKFRGNPQVDAYTNRLLKKLKV